MTGPDVVRFTTYNLLDLFGADTAEARQHYETIVAVIRALDTDVLAVQEVLAPDPAAAAERLRGLADDAGMRCEVPGSPGSAGSAAPDAAVAFGGHGYHVGLMWRDGIEPVPGSLRSLEHGRTRLRASQINGAKVGPQMKGNRWQSVTLLKHRGKKMLPSVLLHMIETALPIDRSLHFSEAQFTVHEVQYQIVLIAHVQYLGLTDATEIVGLPSRSWVERRLVQLYLPCALWARRRTDRLGGKAFEDSCRKGSNVRIVVVQPTGGHKGGSLARERCLSRQGCYDAPNGMASSPVN